MIKLTVESPFNFKDGKMPNQEFYGYPGQLSTEFQQKENNSYPIGVDMAKEHWKETWSCSEDKIFKPIHVELKEIWLQAKVQKRNFGQTCGGICKP